MRGVVSCDSLLFLVNIFMEGKTLELEQRIQWKLSRVKKGIKVKQIAEALSVSSSLISRYEHGQVNMSQKVEKHYLKFIENY